MTPPIEILLRRVCRDLRDAEADFAVVGGLAVGARIGARFTRDVDLALSVTDDEHAERIIGYLIRYGYRPHAEIDHDRLDRLATMRLVPPFETGADPDEGEPIADIICSTCGIEPETVAAATPVAMAPDLTLPIARIPHLIAMKLVSESDQRLQDRIDLQSLCAAATDDDFAEVPPLLDLIGERGFAREKDLHANFARYRPQAT